MRGIRLALIGMRFDDLTVIGRSVVQSKSGSVLWDCICLCGKKRKVAGTALTSHDAKTCGNHPPMGKLEVNSKWDFSGLEMLRPPKTTT